MKRQKVLLTGSSGLLGSNYNFEFRNKYEIFGVYKNYPNPEIKNQFRADLIKKEEVAKIANALTPDLIIHCAALTNLDLCEDNYSLAYETNVGATLNLLMAFNAKTRFIYISTDSVFDGTRGNYRETDLPSPLNNYAKTKLEGESEVEHNSKNYAIIRTNIFGWNRIKGESLAEWVYASLKIGKTIPMFTDVIFSPILVNTLSFLIDKIADTKFIGRLNIGSEGQISKYDFGLLLARKFGFQESLITPFSVDNLYFKARRPKNTTLNLEKARNLLSEMPNLEEEITKFFNIKEASKLKEKFS